MKVIIVCAVLYLIWLAMYFGWQYFVPTKKPTQQIIIPSAKVENIMGQTKSADRQIPPNTANQRHDENTEKQSVTFVAQTAGKYSQVVSREEMESVFSDNKMEIEVDADYLQDEVEQEEVLCFSNGESDLNMAGVGYAEIDNLTKVVSEKESRSEQIAQAAKTAHKVEHTELLDAVMAGYANGLQKVSAMLAKYETMQQATTPQIERFEDFELNNFL